MQMFLARCTVKPLNNDCKCVRIARCTVSKVTAEEGKLWNKGLKKIDSNIACCVSEIKRISHSGTVN